MGTACVFESHQRVSDARSETHARTACTEDPVPRTRTHNPLTKPRKTELFLARALGAPGVPAPRWLRDRQQGRPGQPPNCPWSARQPRLRRHFWGACLRVAPALCNAAQLGRTGAPAAAAPAAAIITYHLPNSRRSLFAAHRSSRTPRAPTRLARCPLCIRSQEASPVPASTHIIPLAFIPPRVYKAQPRCCCGSGAPPALLFSPGPVSVRLQRTFFLLPLRLPAARPFVFHHALPCSPAVDG